MDGLWRCQRAGARGARVQIIDVLAADDIDLGIPVALQTVECLELLFFLLFREVREVFLYYFYHIIICILLYFY